MVTATYRPDAEWQAGQVAELGNRMRQYCQRRGVAARAQWVIELTMAGKPHYHLLVWVPHGFRFPKPDDQGWWPHGTTRIERARNAVGYLVKYATKGTMDLHRIPRGARLFGTWGGDDAQRMTTHRAGLPAWLARATGAGSRCRRIVGGWLDTSTGEVLESPYFVRWREDGHGGSVVEIGLRAAPS